LGGARDGVRFDPCGEPYLEATEAMLEAMRGSGADTVFCGVGGDELTGAPSLLSESPA
jgi:hypothetical protein